MTQAHEHNWVGFTNPVTGKYQWDVVAAEPLMRGADGDTISKVSVEIKQCSSCGELACSKYKLMSGEFWSTGMNVLRVNWTPLWLLIRGRVKHRLILDSNGNLVGEAL